ncbi:hypothetical protein ACI3L3_12880 [Desulfobaculum sp. SPO524]|uniref:hypothetical protein n=1 Tax=Desulfobaculum sp. SPO524 TaxID=3378071 RepID=UPI003853E38C
MELTRDILFFPEMHAPEGAQYPATIKFFDPGLADPADGRYLMPEGLPLSRQDAMNWLGQTTGYAELFQKPGDLRAHSATHEDFFTGSTMDIASELMAMEAPRAEKAEADDAAASSAAKAQGVLLLAWLREQRYRELSSLDAGLDKVWEMFDETVGLDPDDRDEIDHLDADVFAPLGEVAPYAENGVWKPVLEAMLRLLPEQTVLFVREQAVVDEWVDAGLTFADPTPELAEAAQDAPLAEGERLALLVAPGYQLSLRAKLPEGSAWLAGDRTMLVVLRG